MREAFAEQIEGRTFAGLSVRFDPHDPHTITVGRNDVTVRLKIHDGDGAYAGHTTRVFRREYDGTLTVTHSILKLTDGAQGRGFAKEWNGHLEDWYRYSGVTSIEVHASMTTGGYAWARAGYDWAPNTEHRSNLVLGRLRDGMRSIDEHLDQLRRWNDGGEPVDIGALLRRYGAEHPDELGARLRFERDAGQSILDRARDHPFGSDGYPTPEDVSLAGWSDQHGRDAMWLGKQALLGSDWKGVKYVSDGVPRHPRVDVAAEAPGHAPHPAGPITAARVPDSDFDGQLRDVADPAAVRQAALPALRAAAPEAAGLRLSVEVVPADRLPDAAVARSVPVDGQGRALPDGHLPPEDGGYRIELSDRAGDLAVPRAIAHEVAEVRAVRQRAFEGLDLGSPDMLRPGEVADARRLSPHDLGRLAEVDQLLRLREDPTHAEYARRELDALREHLGLGSHDPGAPVRRDAVDGHLRQLGHDPAHLWADGLPGRTSEPAQVTALAVAARTPNGLVDPVALAQFIAQVPALDVSVPGGVQGALEAFTAAAVGNEQARLHAVGGGAGKGQSGAPVYLVRDGSDGIIAVAKIFPAVEELVRELSALDRLGADEFLTFRTPRVEGVAVVPLPDGPAGALIMSVAPGRSLFDLIAQVRGAADRPAALAELHRAVTDAAVSLAELHGRPAGTGGRVDPGFLRFNHGLAQRETASVAQHALELRRLGIDAAELVSRVDEAVAAGLASPGGSSIMHGDAHPGNIFWDPTHGVTLIDAPHSHFSIDGAGRPIGSAARDVANMMERLAHFGLEADLTQGEVARIRTAFSETYGRAGGPPIPPEALTAFTVRFAVRDVLDTLNELQALSELGRPDLAQATTLRAQLATEIRLLRRALGWTP